MRIDVNKLVEAVKNNCLSGYIWPSDKSFPTVYNQQIIETDLLVSNNTSFVVEALLYDYVHALSYNVKYINGDYVIYQYSTEPQDNDELKQYLSNWKDKNGNHLTLNFIRRWRISDASDELCENMQVMMPHELVFIGF